MSTEHTTPTTLTDLSDDLLTAILTHCTPAPLLRLAATSRHFLDLAVCDNATSALAWAPSLRRIGWSAKEVVRRPSAQLYRALTQIGRIQWQSLQLWLNPMSLRRRLSGLTGAASCRLDGVALLFGGTLNGNAGPVYDHLLELALASKDDGRELMISEVAHLCFEEGTDPSPGNRRGHTFTKQPRKCRRLFAIEITLKSVTNSLVQ